MNEYDENGYPIDKEYLECDLPKFLVDSIEQLKVSWDKHMRGESSCWDDDYCELQSNINVAELHLSRHGILEKNIFTYHEWERNYDRLYWITSEK